MSGTSKFMHYGDDGTIHKTNEINVEVHEGEVVAVWFRCMMLPFTVHDHGKWRADSMKHAYKTEKLPKIHAVDVEMPE